MGLFIGASLLTILEILDYLCEVGLGPALGEGRKPRIHLGGGGKRRCGLTTSPTACPQVFLDRVLGYFWNRKRSQRPSSTHLVTAALLPCHLHLDAWPSP